jgi:hypothetical protein
VPPGQPRDHPQARRLPHAHVPRVRVPGRDAEASSRHGARPRRGHGRGGGRRACELRPRGSRPRPGAATIATTSAGPASTDAREDERDDAEAGTLHLDLNPPTASVYVDGEFRGSGRRVENLRLASRPAIASRWCVQATGRSSARWTCARATAAAMEIELER